MAALNLERTLEKVHDRQWALADIDWEAPGADLVTEEQRERLRPFMVDLVWVEHVGGRAFASLARNAEDPTLAELYRYFHAEEERHANAELALMHRWGMLDDGELPAPNVNLRYGMTWLDDHADDMPMLVLASLIPMLEVALDGALLKFLTDAVEDPICQAVFDKVNNDESRHLAVGFEVMDRIGATPMASQLASLARAGANPLSFFGLVAALPLLTQMRNELVHAGLDERRLWDALERFSVIGANGVHTENNVMFRLIRTWGAMMIDGRHPYHRASNTLLALTGRIPSQLLPKLPSWAGAVTYRSAA